MLMPTNDSTTTVVNIVSVSYSGSTWLNLMLGSTPASFSVGEIKSILRLQRALCTLHGDDCPLWSRFDYPGSDNPFVQLHRLTGKRVLVVNNSRKFLPAQQDSRIDAKFIHLIRDGRAAAASYMRKFPGTSMWRAARWWSHDVRRNLHLIRRQPRGNTMLVVYEQIKADPAAHLPAICQFIGMPYAPQMVDYWRTDHHFLGGNRGTLLSMMSKQDRHDGPADMPKVANQPPPQWDFDYYRQHDPAQFRDERWQSELSAGQRRVFALIAGRLNRRLGYPSTRQLR